MPLAVIRAAIAATVTAAAVMLGLPALPAAQAASSADEALFVSAGPTRVLDTRSGIGGYSAPVGAGQSISLQVTGKNGIPSSGVTSVVLNVTAVNPTRASYVTVYPDGQPRPTASNLNFTAGQTFPNLVTVPVGSDGKVDFYNHSGSVDLVADLAGYYTTPNASVSTSLFSGAGPVRMLDTRNGIGGTSTPVGPGQSISLQVSGQNGVPWQGVAAVVLNVTAVNATKASYVTVYPDGQNPPTASNLNFTAGQTIPNLVIVPVGGTGKVDFYNHSGSVDLLADLAGYYTVTNYVTSPPASDGAQFGSVGPVRVLDTRTGTGGYTSPVGPGQSISLRVTGSNGVPAGATAVVLNVTAVNATASSYVTVYPGGQSQPTASDLNFTAGETFPNLVTVPVGTDGTVEFYNHSGSVDLLADLAGYFTTGALTTWTASDAPMPADASNNPGVTVSGVACPSVTACVAAGSYAGPAGPESLLLTGFGSSWATVQTPVPANAASPAASTLSRISCASATACVAAGSYTDSSGNAQGMLVTGSGSSWTAAEVPLPADAGSSTGPEIFQMTCPSATECLAAGQYLDTSGKTEGLLLTGYGSSWTAAEAPLPAGVPATGTAVQISSVACMSVTVCVAGGHYRDPATGTIHAMLVTGSGSSWQAADAPLPPGASPGSGQGYGSRIQFVACPSATECLAAGYYRDASSFFHPILLTWNGSSWSAVSAPLPADAGTSQRATTFTSLACPSTGVCVAGGRYADSSGDAVGMLLTGSPGSPADQWTAVRAPVPAGGREWPYGEAVACPTASACLAVNQYTDSWGAGQIALVSGLGSSWTAGKAPPPANAAAIGRNARLPVVACASASACAAVSTYSDTSDRTEALLLTGPA